MHNSINFKYQVCEKSRDLGEKIMEKKEIVSKKIRKEKKRKIKPDRLR